MKGAGGCIIRKNKCIRHKAYGTSPYPPSQGGLFEQITIASTQVNKRFGALATEFHAAELLHRAVPLVHRIHVLTLVAIACLAFLLGYLRDVHVIGGMEICALHATHRFEIVELEIIAQSSPGIVHQR